MVAAARNFTQRAFAGAVDLDGLMAEPFQSQLRKVPASVGIDFDEADAVGPAQQWMIADMSERAIQRSALSHAVVPCSLTRPS